MNICKDFICDMKSLDLDSHIKGNTITFTGCSRIQYTIRDIFSEQPINPETICLIVGKITNLSSEKVSDIVSGNYECLVGYQNWFLCAFKEYAGTTAQVQEEIVLEAPESVEADLLDTLINFCNEHEFNFNTNPPKGFYKRVGELLSLFTNDFTAKTLADKFSKYTKNTKNINV